MMRFAERLKKVVRDNFVDIAPAGEATAAAPSRAEIAATVAAARAETKALQAAAAAAPPVAPSDAVPAPADETDAVVDENGAVDFDRLFADPAPSRFTTAQADVLLATLPSDLPLRVKRLTVRAGVDALAGAQGATASEVMQAIVADAAQKMLRVARLQETVSEQAATQKAEAEQALARRQAQNESDLATFQANKIEEARVFCQDIENEIAEKEAQIILLNAQISRLQAEISEKAPFLTKVVAQNETAVATKAEAKAALLQAEAATLNARCEQAEKRSDSVRRACRQRMNALNDIVLFFDEAQMATAAPSEQAAAPEAISEDNELPAFLREDTAAKLLGISGSTLAAPARSTH